MSQGIVSSLAVNSEFIRISVRNVIVKFCKDAVTSALSDIFKFWCGKGGSEFKRVER